MREGQRTDSTQTIAVKNRCLITGVVTNLGEPKAKFDNRNEILDWV